ncbi:VOC family protein [Rahnella sp. EDr1-12]|uniref:VOC family protein n=1 Tax=unclassified Rahnella TaxID=2635087 RepID=UPI003BAB03BA
MENNDIGLSHIAFAVKDLDASIRFYQQFADMKVVHRRTDARPVAWLSDMTRHFAIVLAEDPENTDTRLGPFGHLGVACASREAMDARLAEARTAGVLRQEPTDSGAPVGYWAFLDDPDGNTLELSYGQEIGYLIESKPTL